MSNLYRDFMGFKLTRQQKEMAQQCNRKKG